MDHIPDSGYWSPIEQTAVDNAYNSVVLNTSEIEKIKDTSKTKITVPTLKQLLAEKGEVDLDTEDDKTRVRIYKNLSKNNFNDERKRLAKKLFTARP
jgi:hypothetical protein